MINLYDSDIQALLTDNAVKLGYNENKGTGALLVIIKSLQ